MLSIAEQEKKTFYNLEARLHRCACCSKQNDIFTKAYVSVFFFYNVFMKMNEITDTEMSMKGAELSKRNTLE